MRHTSSHCPQHRGTAWACLTSFLMLCPAALAAAPQTAPAAGAEEAAHLELAEVDGEAITLAYLRELFERRHSGHGALFTGEEIVRMVLDSAVEDLLLIQEGHRMGIPEEAAVREVTEVYRDLLRLRKLEERFIREPAEPSEEEIKSAHARLSRLIRVGVIDTREKDGAEEALRRLQNGEDFDSVARQMSVHRSRLRGGNLGWVRWGQLDPLSEEAVLNAAAGTIAGPLGVDGRFRILKVSEIKQVEPPVFEEVENKIRAVLRLRRRAAIREELLASIRKAHPPEQDEAALARFLTSSEEAGSGADPPDAAVLMRTDTGLELSAGKVRQRARRARTPLEQAWKAAVEDALLIDEARRRINADSGLEHRMRQFVDQRVRSEMEQIVVLENLSISDEEQQAFYDENPAAFTKLGSHHLRHIVLGSQAEAEEVRRALTDGADFARLARERSLDEATAVTGGDLGWVSASRARSHGTLAEAIFALQPGEISEVLEVASGYSMVQVLEVRPERIPPFEEVPREVYRRLVLKKKKERRQVFLDRLREHAEVRIFDGAVARAVELQARSSRERLAPATQPVAAQDH